MVGIILFVFFISSVIYMHFSTMERKRGSKKEMHLLLFCCFLLLQVIMYENHLTN